MVNTAALRQEIEQVIQDLPVTFGVAIKYLESGEELTLNDQRTYQLASVFKVPVLVTAMQQIDAGRFSLDDRVTLKDEHKTSPSGIICYLRPGLNLTVEDLLMLMIIISDNTATDMVLDLVGGPAAVNEAMRKLGFAKSEMNITLSVHDLFEDVFGSSECVLLPSQMVAQFRERGINFDHEVFQEGSTINVAKPSAMNRLHEMIYHGQVASRWACDKALEIMLHQTLNARLPGLLPPGTDVAHKTGTLMGVRNDSGIIYVAGDCHVIVTVLTEQHGKRTVEEMEDPQTAETEAAVDKAIARIGKLAYDYAKK